MFESPKLPSPRSSESNPAKRVAILDAAPIYSVLDSLIEQLAYLKSVVPMADATTLLRRVTDAVEVAVRAGESGGVWVDVDEVSRTLGITPQAVTLRCRNGRLIAKKIGGHWFVLLSSLR